MPWMSPEFILDSTVFPYHGLPSASAIFSSGGKEQLKQLKSQLCCPLPHSCQLISNINGSRRGRMQPLQVLGNKPPPTLLFQTEVHPVADVEVRNQTLRCGMSVFPL